MKDKNILPKDFFTQPRPEISLKEALKDVTPIIWLKDDKKKKTFSSIREKK